MSRRKYLVGLVLSGWLAGCRASITPAMEATWGPNNYVDDSAILVTSEADVARTRADIIAFVWGPNAFPSERRPTVQRDIASPVDGLDTLGRVDQLTVTVTANAGPVESLAYHFIPRAPNGHLVIMHNGHVCYFNEPPAADDEGYGLQRTIKGLLDTGASVLAIYMPRQRPGECESHVPLFDNRRVDDGRPFRYFLEPIAADVNYLRTASEEDDFPVYTDFSMIGLSGGGWSTVVYSAIDPTIGLSIDVAGSQPLYLRGNEAIDIEQFDDAFYARFGYPDLYVLGAHGTGRRRIQVLNRHDDCCFGEAQHDPDLAGTTYDDAIRIYEADVRAALAHMGAPSFEVHIDEAAPSHMISWETLNGIILPALAASQ
jgi:hypothetical protein